MESQAWQMLILCSHHSKEGEYGVVHLSFAVAPEPFHMECSINPMSRVLMNNGHSNMATVGSTRAGNKTALSLNGFMNSRMGCIPALSTTTSYRWGLPQSDICLLSNYTWCFQVSTSS